MACEHQYVKVWVLEEVGDTFDRTNDEWAGNCDYDGIKEVISATCEECGQDLTEDIRKQIL